MGSLRRGRLVWWACLSRQRLIQNTPRLNHRLSRDRLVQINRLIVQCAEETVLFRDAHPWVAPFVARNRHFRIEPYTFECQTPRGLEPRSGQRVVARVPPVAS